MGIISRSTIHYKNGSVRTPSWAGERTPGRTTNTGAIDYYCDLSDMI
ncbi:hypothetical protein [Microcoleus sp. bin38.metabat.b11b12b14.051]|nr:hypothetical protein [Microcoleus sp. bin38.metabat.b11b12b14.051]